MSSYEDRIEKRRKKYITSKPVQESTVTPAPANTTANKPTVTYAANSPVADRLAGRAAKYSDTAVDDAYISSFLNDAQRYNQSNNADSDRIGFGNSNSIYLDRKRIGNDLSSRSNNIRRYLNENKNSIPSEYYEEFIAYLDNFDRWNAGSLHSYYNQEKFYSQFDSEEAYNHWLKYGTQERRQAQYEQNVARLEELQNQQRESRSYQPGMNPYLSGESTTSGSPYGAAHQNPRMGMSDTEKEIEQLRKEILLYERGGTDETGFYYGFKAADDYGELRENEDFGALSANRGFQNPSRDELIRGDSLSDSSSWYYDANGVYRDAYGNALETDASGNWVNPNAQGYTVTDRLGLYLSASEEERQEAVGTPVSMEGTWESVIKDGYDGNWELLTKDEIDIYYYLLNSSGQETADKYLADMKVELNRRNTQNATDRYTEAFDEANALERLAMSIATTPAQLFSGAAGFIENAAMTLMGKDINPYSAAHGGMNFSNTVRSEQAKAFDEATGGIAIPFIDFTVGDLYQAGMSAFDMAVGGRLGAGAYEVLMGMGSASSEAKRLYEQGASNSQIAWGGALAGAAEMIFEHASIENLINLKDADTVGQLVKNILIQGGIEASEEGFTEIANTITNAIVMGDDSDWAKLLVEHDGDYLAALIAKAQEVGNAAFSGFVSGGIGGGKASVASYAQTQAENKEIGQYISGANSTDALVALAQEMASGASGKDQKRLTAQSDRLGKKFLTEGGKNRATGRLYNTVRSVVTEQNIGEISSALQEKGFSKKDAVAIAGAVAVQANGMELTDNQQKTLQKFESNETVQNVLNEVLGNEESGINQRARSIAKFEFGAMRNHITSQMEQSAAIQENGQNVDNLDTPNKNGAESSYEVSADGKTILKSTGEIVNVQSIADVRDGQMILRLDNGSTVNAEDVSYSSAGEALVYETVAQMGASVKAANILVNQFKATEGMAAEVFAQGIKEAFRYGMLGIPASKLASSTFASKLNAGQQEYVYRQGQKAAGKQVAKEQATVQKSVQAAKNSGKESNKSYRAVLEDGITEESLNESQKVSYKLAGQVAEAAKVNIRVYVGKTGEWGYYNPNTDEIHLNLNSTNKSGKSMMAFTLGHELVHRAKKGSPAKYKAFANFLMEEYSKNDASVEKMIAEQMEAAKDHNIELTEEKAFEEVVCDACQRMLLDTDAGKKLAEFGAQSKQNKSFLEELKQWIEEFLNKLRSIFDGVDTDSMAAKEFAKFDAGVKQILADMYVDMTIDAGENLSTIQNAFGKGTVVETNEHGEFTMASSQDGSERLFNLTTWNNGGRETLEATLLREGYTEDEVKAALTIMDEKQNLVERIANEVDDNGKMAFPEQGRINEATLTTDLKDGHSVLSALVSNGDYPVNIDLLMVCKKRKAYQRVINRLCETGLIQQATVDALAIAEINKILGKYGFETACLGCFVESRRLRIQEWAQTICKEWNAEVKKRNPNAKAFGFGKGEAKLTPEEVMKIIGELESGGPKNDKGNLNLGQGSAVKRMGVLLDKVPSLRRTLSIEDLITPDGLSSLRSFDSNLFSMVKSRYGSNSPKFVQEFNPYNHELAMYGKVPSEYKSLREYLYAIGGARMQSFSDFIVENWFDYCQIVADLAARKLPMHTYTKEISLAKLFGLTGIKINMSLIPDIDKSLGKESAGLTLNAKGELELIWADKDRFKATGGKSYMQSINFADAIALQNDPRYSANVGTIAIGVSDKQILMMLDDARIRMVIPYHSSGMNPIFADLMGTSYYKDYTDFQNTKVKQLYNSKGQPVSVKLEKAQNDKLVSGFHFNAVLQELGDARAAAEAYKEWCADASKHTITIKGETYTAELTPKFDDFSWHDNYYKLLEDFNTYDCISEQAAPQGDVQQIYPEDFDNILEAELKAQEGHRQKQEANQAFDKAMGEIESYLKNHTKADTVHYAQQHGIKLSKKDSKLDAADKAKLKKLQEDGASFKLPIMGDKKSPSTLTEQDLRDLLKKAKNEEMDDGTYFPVRINTPDILLDFVRAVEKSKGVTGAALERLTADNPVAIPVKKAKQAMAIASEWYGDGDAHELAIEDIISIVKKMDTPRYLVYEDSTGRYVEVINYRSAHGKNAIAVVEMDDYKDEPYMNGYGGANYSILITLFPPDAKDRVTRLLKTKENIFFDVEKKKGNSQVTSGIHVPSVLNKSPFAPSLPQVEDDVKVELDRRYLDAVKLGDMETAQKMVDEAAKKAGFPARVLHGTQKFGFTVLDTSLSDDELSFFATSDVETAKTYSSLPGKRGITEDANYDDIDSELENLDKAARDSAYNLADAISSWAGYYGAADADFIYDEFDRIADAGDGFANTGTADGDMYEVADEIIAELYNADFYDGMEFYEWQETDEAEKLYTEVNKTISKFLAKYEFDTNAQNSGNYDLYANTDGLLEIDFMGAKWDKLNHKVLPDITSEDYKKYGYRGHWNEWTTRSVAKYAYDMGYRGVLFKNIIDDGGKSASKVTKPADVYVFFDPQKQVKSADPVTYDDSGNVIPLSERFNSEKDDIRYKLPVGEDTSPRALLSNAFETVITNPIEKSKLEEYKDNIALINAEERKLQELREQIKELSFAKGPKDTKKIRELQFEATQTANRINTYDKILLRMEASKPLQNVLNREKEMVRKREKQKHQEALAAYREKSAKTQRELINRYQESRKKAVENREKTAMRHKIQNVVGELNNLLLSNDKKRHVPESLKKAVADALALVNMDTVGAEERAAKYAALIAKETDPDKIDAYTVTMENILRQGEKMGQRLKELRDAYEEIQESDDPDIANAYDPVIAGCLRELSQSIGNTSLRNMTIEQLSDVYDMYRMVLTRVRDANKTLLENIKESISNLASRVIGEVRMTGGEHKYRAAILDPVRKFLWNNLKPVYAMEHIGSSTLTKVFDNVRVGEDTWAKDVTEARGYYLDKSRKYGYDTWDFKKKYRFTSASELEFELTLEQILSLYAYSKREQAGDHLRLGGFVFDSNIETYEEKGSKILKYKVNTADAHQITPEILTEIITTLTSEQMGFVDEMQNYLSTVMGAKGNEVTMKMYGVKLFKEKFYFPLKSAKQFMFEQNEVSGEVRIKNSGFTNKVVAKANNPVILSNFMDVWAAHVNDMSMYHAFVLPLEDFNRVFNYNSPKKENQPPVSVKGTIQNAYSPAAVNYVKNLITDLNGGARSDSTTGVINKMMGMFKKGAVFASASVVIQQPSAIARAAALVDTKYFIGPKVDHKRHKALWDEVKQYAPVAIIKEMGYFDTNMGKSTQDFILGKEYSGFSAKMKALVTDSDYRDEILSKAPALADEIAWCSIWEAVKRETKAKHPGLDVKGEPFLMLAGSRFTEVITKTQVYDSVLSRSANMRSKDTGMKMATAFMAEPTTSINMIADALLQGKRGNRKYCRAAIGAVIASQILNSFLVAFVYAARDDDEDESYLEKYIGSFTAEMLDGMNPLTYIPFIKDIISIVQGYDVERSDMAVISDLWNAVQQLKSDKLSAWRKVEGFVGSICQIFGLPVKNIMRDTRAVWQVFDTIVNGEKTTARGIGYAVKGAITGNDVSNPDQLYEARLAGDEGHAARVEARYDDEDSANAAVRQAIKERFMAGEIDTMTALRQMVLYAGMDASEAHWLMDAWEYRKAMGTDEGYSKYNDFFEAVQTGKNLKAVIKEYTDNGVKKDTLASMITNYFKPEYIEMSASERASIKGYLLNALEQCGVDREDAEERLADWDFEAKHGFSYSDRKEAYLNGEVSVSELRTVLIETGGYTEEDADLQIESYDWAAQGYEGATLAAVREYNEHCAAENVPKDVYLYIRSFSNNTENDVDEVTGKTIYYSAMKKVMAEINAQNLTSAQKTAIARSLGWSEKNINKYKTW